MFERQEFIKGFKAGFPIFIGYFFTSLAFGLICKTIGMSTLQAVLTSVGTYTGAGQFLMVRMISAGSALVNTMVGVVLLNLRYIFMGASLLTKMGKDVPVFKRLVTAFGITDECFVLASSREGAIVPEYYWGIAFVSYLGWVAGTAVGCFTQTVLPAAIQQAAGITCFAMFASLLATDSKEFPFALVIGAVSAGINSLLIVMLKFPTGWAFVISMLIATVFGALSPQGKAYVDRINGEMSA